MSHLPLDQSARPFSLPPLVARHLKRFFIQTLSIFGIKRKNERFFEISRTNDKNDMWPAGRASRGPRQDLGRDGLFKWRNSGILVEKFSKFRKISIFETKNGQGDLETLQMVRKQSVFLAKLDVLVCFWLVFRNFQTFYVLFVYNFEFCK